MPRPERAPVHPAVFGAVQLIYVARPSFGPGLHNPIPRRSGVRRGEDDNVTIPDVLPEPPPENYASEAAPFGPAEGLDELCDALRGRFAGEPHVRQHLLQAARTYVRQHGPNIDQAALVAALEAVALEQRTRVEVAGYGVDRLVDRVVRQERAATSVLFGRPAPKEILPPFFGEEAPNVPRDWLQRNCLCAITRH